MGGIVIVWTVLFYVSAAFFIVVAVEDFKRKDYIGSFLATLLATHIHLFIMCLILQAYGVKNL